MFQSSESRDLLHRRVAQSIKLARKRYGTMRGFTEAIREAIGWPSLSTAAVYAWEAGATRVPAVALVAAADLAGIPLEHLLRVAAGGSEELTPSSALPDEVLDLVARLERRVDHLERRLGD